MSITSIMESIIRYFADLTGNPGWSIIIVTVLIKIITHPLSVSQIRSMEQIKVVTPKVKELEAKYKGQPQEYQRRLAELYRDNKINPLAGCLPSLIPLPILIVFRVLQNREFVLISRCRRRLSVDARFGGRSTTSCRYCLRRPRGCRWRRP